MRFFAPILLLSFSLISCAAKHPVPANPATSNKTEKEIEQTTEFLPQQIESNLGEAIFIRILRTTKQLAVSDEFKTYTAEITKKLAESSHRPALNYETIILDSKDPLAMGLPGGKILISKGFLDLVKSESEYANLIANQIGHIAKQHLLHDLMMNPEFAESLTSGDVSERAIKQSIFILLDLGFGVKMINSADRLAPTYAMHVGYETTALQTLLTSVQTMMSKKHSYGKTDLTFDMLSHRVSMNGVFVKGLSSTDKSGFPKAEDRFAAMFKKIKPVKKKQ